MANFIIVVGIILAWILANWFKTLAKIVFVLLLCYYGYHIIKHLIGG